MFRRNILYISLILTLFSCNNNDVVTIVNDQVGEELFELQKTGTKNFELDTLTSNSRLHSIQYLPGTQTGGGQPDMFTLLNRLDNSIYFYDYSNSKYLFKLKLAEDGPDGVGNIDGYQIISLDTIVIFRDHPTYLYLVDTTGHVWKKIAEPYPASPKYAATTDLTTGKPAVLNNNKIITIGRSEEEWDDDTGSSRNVLIIHDMQSLKNEYTLNFPEFYNKGNWWGSALRETFGTVNRSKSILALSYSASHWVYTYDYDSRAVHRYWAGSNFIKNIKSSPEKYEQVPRKATHFYVQSDKYANIVYDKYRDCYYRFTYLGPKNFNKNDENTFWNDQTIIVLDGNFQFIGETKIPSRTYDPATAIATPDGLMIQNRSIKDENIVSYDLFKLSKK